MVANSGLRAGTTRLLSRICIVGLVWACAVTGASATTFPPLYSRIKGSPFVTSNPTSVAFSPTGSLLAAVNAVKGDATGSAVSVFSVDPVTHRLTPVSGSPFTVGYDPREVAFRPTGGMLAVTTAGGVELYSIDPSTHALSQVASASDNEDVQGLSFSADGNLLALPNEADNTISLFSVGQNALTPVAGSPFADTFGGPWDVAFSPDGTLLAAANGSSHSVALFNVDPTTHALTKVNGSPFPAGPAPESIAFSPSGKFVAAISGDTNQPLNLYAVNPATHRLTQVPGSPLSLSGSPRDVTFSPNGRLIAVAEDGDLSGQVEMLALDASTGKVTESPGSPYQTGPGPESVAFSPNGALFATANNQAFSIGLFGTPACRNVTTSTGYRQTVAVQLSCADALGARLKYSIVSAPGHGSLSAVHQATGRVSYNPHPGFSGVDRFQYQASSRHGSTLTYLVRVRVLPNNQFTVSGIRAKSDGTLSFSVNVPGRGAVHAVELSHQTQIAHTDRTAGRSSALRMVLTPAPAERKTLMQKKQSVGLTVTYRPTGGRAHTKSFSGIRT
ncbi:MAG: beta-propeller fold lactonase family protein [Solirubrobacteraceae bacterium]